jgi:thymidylate kinase
MDNRLIMITGSAPGAGKSTLMSKIAKSLRDRDVSVLEVDEDALWGKRQLGRSPIDLTAVWPEFRELLHEPRPQTSPTAAAVLHTFQRIQNRADPQATVWIQDWSWLDLGTMVLGSKTDEHRLAAFSNALRSLAEPLNPAVLYLRINPETALRRAVAERGSVWFERHAVGEVKASTFEERVVALAALYGKRDDFRRRILEEGDWNPFYIDGSSKHQAVFNAALTALGLKT